MQGGVDHEGWSGSLRGGMDHAGMGWVGWVMQGWDGLCHF